MPAPTLRLRDGRFVALNCGAVPETMFESEIFGHEAGAFTGAQKRRIGKLEHAAGELFLDEIRSHAALDAGQAHRAVQQRQVVRLGSNELIDVEVRIVASTKADLATLSDEQKFRRDLYYRLNVVSLEIPPLRDRREDIPILFEHFVLQAAQRYRREAPIAPDGLVRRLMAHGWPGNVRELRNVADRFVLDVLGTPFRLAQGHAGASVKGLAEQVDGFERSVIVAAETRPGQRRRRERGSGDAQRTLYDKIHKHTIAPEWFR